MTISVSILIDIFILAFLAIFIISGIRHGLIMTFTSMLAVFAAIACGWFLSCHYADALAAALQPGIESKINDYIVTNNVVADSSTLLGMGYSQAFTNAIQSMVAGDTAFSLSNRISSVAARSVMFLIGFVVIMVVWGLLSHILDLVTRYPVLHALDRTLGGIMGFLLGYVFLLLIHWILCDLICCIPQNVLEGSYLAPLLISRPLFFFVSG